MILTLSCLFLAFSLGSRTKVRILFCAIVFTLLFAIESGLIPHLMLSGLQDTYLGHRESGWQKSSVIVLLGAGSEKSPDGKIVPSPFSFGRLLKARQLYEECAKVGQCTLLVSGGDPQHNGRTEAAVYGDWLKSTGVASSDVLVEEKSSNTWENARNSTELLKKLSFDQIVLVDSASHLRRTEIYFRHFGVVPELVYSDFIATPFTIIPNSFYLTYTEVALHEYVGIARYYIYSALGWNEPSGAAEMKGLR
jgi:uncharacterized SAM-binding protein YcdF (DUF218 family)